MIPDDKKTYAELLKERTRSYSATLDRLYPEDYEGPKGWKDWCVAIKRTPNLRVETLEALCVEFACQLRRQQLNQPDHLPLLCIPCSAERAAENEKLILKAIRANAPKP